MQKFPVLISENEIDQRIRGLGEEITTRFKNEKGPVIILGVLKGSFVFLADLVRYVDLDLRIDFVEAQSYGAGTVSTGEVKLTRDVALPIEGKSVVLVEDIVDTGHTVDFLKTHLEAHRPKSISVCSFLYKPSRKVKDVKIDFLGFTIEDHFVIGYGLDFDGRFRHLPHIAVYQVES